MNNRLAAFFLIAAFLSGWTDAQEPATAGKSAPVIDRVRIDGVPLPGPISPYYLTAGEQGKDWVVQGMSVINTWNQQHKQGVGEYAIVVTDSVRDLGSFYQNNASTGSQYTLAGVYTGTNYPYPLAQAAFWDGASDGIYNYSVEFNHGRRLPL